MSLPTDQQEQHPNIDDNHCGLTDCQGETQREFSYLTSVSSSHYTQDASISSVPEVQTKSGRIQGISNTSKWKTSEYLSCYSICSTTNWRVEI